MIIELSVSNDLNRWMGVNAPRFPRKGSDIVGAQTISNDEELVSWQCHVLTRQKEQADPYYTVVAVQPHSRYTLLIPYLTKPTLDQLAGDIVYRWGNELMHRLVDSGAIQKGEVGEAAEQFKTSERSIFWYLNSDPDLFDRACAAEQWITSYLDAFDLDYLEEDHAIDLGAHINSQKATKEGMVQDDAAIQGFVNDGAYRFACGLCGVEYENTFPGNFPNPWGETPPLKAAPGPAKLVAIDKFRKT